MPILIVDNRRAASEAEKAEARRRAAEVARDLAADGAHYARIANGVTDTIISAVDAKVVKPASLSALANGCHRAVKAAARAEGATPDSIADAVAGAAEAEE